MNKQTLLGALLCMLTTAMWGQANQVAQFSYISDRTFTSPDQLMGYDFKPAMRELPGEEPEEFSVGKYSFGITNKNLYVEGPEIQGVYSVNNINTTEYGFILATMNARDPTIQGHLKVVVDELGQVEGLIFKRSTHEKEVIFFLRSIPEAVDEAEAKYFTNKGQQRIKHIDSLWNGVEVRPFLRVFAEMGGIQQRIIMADSVYLNFYKVVTVEEKEKKKIGIGKKKSKEVERVEQAPEETFTEATIDMEAAKKTREDLLTTLGVSPDSALVKQEPVEMEEILGNKFDDSPIDSLMPVQDSTMVAALLDSLVSDSLAVLTDSPPIDSSEIKVKITTEFFVDLNSFMRFEDGTSTMQHRTFSVKGIAERENPNARPGGDRFQWELEIHKRPNAYIYLDDKYRVNSIFIDGQKFYMRGE